MTTTTLQTGLTRSALRDRLRATFAWTARSLSVRLGVLIVVFFLLVSFISLVWTPYPPGVATTGLFNAPPSWHHLFGTDAAAGDVFSRTLVATTKDVWITVAVVSLSLGVGIVWGSVIGFVGGPIDAVSLRVLQAMNSFPSLLLAMLVISTLGQGLLDVILVAALIPLPDYVRLARAEIMSKKTWQFAEAAAISGRRPIAVLFRHLVPNSTRPLFAYAAVNGSWVVSMVGALGYLGLGIQPGSAEWGSMIAGGQSGIVTGQWWMCLFPGIGLFLLAAALHLIGDGLADEDLVRRGY
jgi:peptide/nickel transport system permease protein